MDARLSAFYPLSNYALIIRLLVLIRHQPYYHMKLTTTVVFLLACHLANAQFSKGDIFVAGGYSITVQKSDYDNGEDNKNRSFYVYPEIGYFLNHQYAVGGGLSFYSSRNRYEPSQGNYQEATDRALGAYLF